MYNLFASRSFILPGRVLTMKNKMMMNCLQCHHTYQAHEKNSPRASSILRVGKCLVPGCDCTQYVDKIETIDEDLL
ncbi:hypothetical protein NTE_01451 [Candidatus Nitrososphaera evergladensis SR1]|jgi:hypothetical protein|uniref:Uncharacterized protein n=2 Tax=Nitrososphaera TaxID=497726 RepID=A0A075MQY3_9ARCH|nr:hypothetical protein NTE_01451 [Candidatus Nitrososphaera evergladensis SR1]